MTHSRTLGRRIERLERRDLLSATVMEHDGVAYFLDAEERGFDRYDLVSEQWLESVAFAGAPAEPTIAHVDDDGFYVAYYDAVYRYDFDGTELAFVYQTPEMTTNIFTDGDLLLLKHNFGFGVSLVSFDKHSNSQIDILQRDYDSFHGSSIATQTNRIYGRTGGSPGDIVYTIYSDSGEFFGSAESSYHGDYPDASRTWAFDDGSRVIDNSGTVYTATLRYAGRLGQSVTDIDFYGGQVPVVLTGSTITAYTAEFRATGSFKVNGKPTELFVNDRHAIAFEKLGDEWVETLVPLARMNTPAPGEAVNPIGLKFTPDKLEMTAEGVALMYSQQHASVFRYDTIRQDWMSTITLSGTTLGVAYSAAQGVLYVSYDDGRITRISLADETLEERPFVQLEVATTLVYPVEEFVLIAAWWNSEPRTLTLSSEGELIDESYRTYWASRYSWNHATREVYYLDYQGTINAFGIDVDGRISDSPTWASLPSTYDDYAPPLVVSNNGTAIVTGTGNLLRADGLQGLSVALANPISDAAWIDNRLYSVRSHQGQSQLQAWTGYNWGLTKSRLLPGSPVALRAIDGDRLLLVTRDAGGVLRLTVVDQDFQTNARPTPVAIAGEDRYVYLGASTTLDGSASHDPDNRPGAISYAWTLVEGPGAVEFQDPTAAVTTFTADVEGDYRVALSVSDGEQFGTDIVIVSYRLNTPPVLDVSHSATAGVVRRGSVVLSAAGSYDLDGDDLDFDWQLVRAPDGADWNLFPSFSLDSTAYLQADTPGEYEVRVTVSDGVHERSTTTLVTFAENQAPTPRVSSTHAVGVVGVRPVKLDATASTDPEGDYLSYTWEIVAGPDLSAVTLEWPYSRVASLRSSIAGTYEVRLTVRDGLDSASIDFQVEFAENRSPVVDLSLLPTTLHLASGAVLLDGSRSHDPDGDLLTYVWRIVASSNETTPSLYWEKSPTAYFSPSKPGVYGLELVVSDGVASGTGYAFITVLGNQAPVAIASTSGSVVYVGEDITLDASLSHDGDGDALSYTWSVLAGPSSGLAAIVDRNAATTTLHKPAAGAHVIQLKVDDGQAAATDLLIITVSERPARPPLRLPFVPPLRPSFWPPLRVSFVSQPQKEWFVPTLAFPASSRDLPATTDYQQALRAQRLLLACDEAFVNLAKELFEPDPRRQEEGVGEEEAARRDIDETLVSLGA